VSCRTINTRKTSQASPLVKASVMPVELPTKDWHYVDCDSSKDAVVLTVEYSIIGEGFMGETRRGTNTFYFCKEAIKETPQHNRRIAPGSILVWGATMTVCGANHGADPFGGGSGVINPGDPTEKGVALYFKFQWREDVSQRIIEDSFDVSYQEEATFSKEGFSLKAYFQPIKPAKATP